MLLLWLLLVPSARATIECHSACSLCAMDSNKLTAACTLCRECHKVHLRMMGSNKQMLNNRQDQALKDLERREFRQLMKEYGWSPEDLEDSGSRVEKLADVKDCIPPPSPCISNDDSAETLAYKITKCPTLPNTRYCPTPTWKKKLDINKRRPHQKKLSFPLTKSTMPLMIMNQIVTLRYETVDQGPTETTCPDLDIHESEESLNDESGTQPTLPTTKTTCRPRKLTTEQSYTNPCMPCMPLCPLPCGTEVPKSPILPSIPPEALDALMTLKPSTLDDKKTITTQATHSTQGVEEKIEERIKKLVFKHTTTESTDSSHSVVDKLDEEIKKMVFKHTTTEYTDSSQSVEEKLDEKIKKLVFKHTTTDSSQSVEENIRKKVFKHTSNLYIEDTTKDYVYMYVGIPKDDRFG